MTQFQNTLTAQSLLPCKMKSLETTQAPITANTPKMLKADLQSSVTFSRYFGLSTISSIQEPCSPLTTTNTEKLMTMAVRKSLRLPMISGVVARCSWICRGPGQILESSKQSLLAKMIWTFCNKPFLRHQAQGHEQAAVVKTYKDQKGGFYRHVCCIFVATISADSNVIQSEVIYKVNKNDDATLMLKARIALHGNGDSQKLKLLTNWCMFSASEVRIHLSVAAIRRWRNIKADVKSAYGQA